MKAQLIHNPNNDTQYAVHPKKFMMWVFIAAIVMMFAGLTSAYIVQKGNPKGWVNFELPSSFLYTTIIILLSSVTLWWATNSAKKDEITNVKTGLLLTLFLGILFCIGQWMGWQDMISRRLFLTGGPVSSSFIYVIPGLHLLHIIGGLLYIAWVSVKAFNYKVHKTDMLSISLLSTYWHFVGFLWVYLYIFFVIA
jgi:cytochrome c oxidase subunit 3